MGKPDRERAAWRLMKEMHEMLDDIAASAVILGATPFNGREAARRLGADLNTALLEFETAMAAQGEHEFQVKE